MSCSGTLQSLEILVQYGETNTWLERNSRVFCCSSIKSRISFLVLLLYVVMACWTLPNLHRNLFKCKVTSLIISKFNLTQWETHTKKNIYMLKYLLHQECFSSCMSFAVISHGTVHFSLLIFLTLCSFWLCRNASSKSSANVTGSSSTALFMSYFRRMACDLYITFHANSN